MTAVSARNEPLLEIRSLRASYGAVEVLRGVDFTVNRGEIVALLGTNGAGKSTILRCISGLLKPDAGEILFEGKDLAAAAAHVSQARAQVNVARSDLLPHLTGGASVNTYEVDPPWPFEP